MTAGTGIGGSVSSERPDNFSEIDAALARGDVETARARIDASIGADANGGDTALEAGACLRLAYCDLTQSRVRRARDGSVRAARAFRETGAPTDEVDALALWAQTAGMLGRNVEAVETALLAARLAEDLPAGMWTARAYTSLGMAYGWAGAFVRSEEAFEIAAQVIERHLDGSGEAELTVTRAWFEAIRWCKEGRPAEHRRRFPVLQQQMARHASGPTGQLSKTLLPGAVAGQSAAENLLLGFMSLRSGQVDEATAALMRCADAGPAPVGWILAAQSWLATELAMLAEDWDVASMHATRMSALASEVEHLPLRYLGHELASSIFVRHDSADLALAEQRMQLDCERAMRLHDLEGRADIVDLQVTARHGGALIDELAATAMKFEKWAHEDSLTGIANLRRFNQCVREWSAESAEGGHPLCVALIDVDRFKSINDGFSYEVGNQALRGIAAEMTAHVRETDLAARWGGDEFAILFRDTDMPTAEQIALRIQQAVALRDWSSVAEGLEVSISVGVTEVQAGDSKTSLIARSEDLMYAQKLARRRAEAEKAISPLVLRTVTEWLRRAERVVVFVGPGTEEQARGLLSPDRPAAWGLEDRRYFGPAHLLQADPKAFASVWVRWRTEARQRRPSAAHHALVELAHRLPQVLFVTERIDNVLARAGAENVVEVYGNGFRHRCGACARVSPNRDRDRCLACGNPTPTIRPDIVLPGEHIDDRLVIGTEFAVKQAHVILLVDCDATSQRRISAVLEKGRSRGARVVVLNGGGTRLSATDVSIVAPVETIAAMLAQAMDEPPAEASANDRLSEGGLAMFEFLTEQRTDNFGVTLSEVLAWKDWEVATCLGAVPWMFPLTTRSAMNPEAPMPTQHDFETLAGDARVRSGMRKAFVLMLRFYGFGWRDGRVARAESWRNGFAIWAIMPSHHDLFISRILGALTLTGLKDEAVAFLDALEVELQQYRGGAHGALWHWRLAVHGRPSGGGDRKAA